MGRGDGCRYNAVYTVRMRAADKWGKGYSNQRHQLGIRGLKVIATYNKDGEISTPKAGSFRAVLIPHCTMRLLEHMRGERVKACYFGSIWRTLCLQNGTRCSTATKSRIHSACSEARLQHPNARNIARGGESMGRRLDVRPGRTAYG